MQVAEWIKLTSDPTVRVQYIVCIAIITVAKFLFGSAMVARDIRKGGPNWPLHWNMLVGLWILSNGMFFAAAFMRLQYRVDLIYLLRTLQVATVMTIWVGFRWAKTDQDGNTR